MNKVSKNLLILFLALVLGSYFSIFSAQAQDDKLILEVTKKCDFQYSGDSCVAELKITNNTGRVLDGEASSHINYQGMCSGNKLINFDGAGITAQFSINNVDWLNFSGWENGTTAVSGFEIVKGETQPKLKIETVPNLCPGKYTFNLELKGGEYITPPVTVGGGGGGYSSVPTSISPLSGAAQQVDTNSDGKVDVLDFVSLLANWGKTESNTAGDFNSDGKVDIFDFNLLMINWTK
ncbi:MAG: hypothetical protein NTV77_02430 [Candidatus Azambacteria bacterium]|nr:hypothetical protein [Candidatus Azambacteria bacterium]